MIPTRLSRGISPNESLHGYLCSAPYSYTDVKLNSIHILHTIRLATGMLCTLDMLLPIRTSSTLHWDLGVPCFHSHPDEGAEHEENNIIVVPSDCLCLQTFFDGALT